MRVLWLNHRDLANPRSGGAERTIVEVGSRLVARGHIVTMVTGGWTGAPKHSNLNGVSIVRYPGNILPHVAALSILHSGHRPDVVVDDLAHVVPWGSSRIGSIPTVVFFRHLHGRTLEGQIRPPWSNLLVALEQYYRQIYPDAIFVTESRQSVRDLESLGISPTRTRPIPPVLILHFSTRLRCQPSLRWSTSAASAIIRDRKRQSKHSSDFETWIVRPSYRCWEMGRARTTFGHCALSSESHTESACSGRLATSSLGPSWEKLG